jgi:carbonic anhydrase/acetyltransferase-like protein (isoleucine patch superfamily)
MLYKFGGKQPVLGKETYVSETATVIGDVVIGDNCYIGHGAVIRGDYGRIEIGNDNAVIGLGASVSIWSEIGEWAIVAEGAVVKLKQVVPAKTVVAGNPARVVRKVNAEDRKMWSWGKQIYVDLAKKYLKEGMTPVV